MDQKRSVSNTEINDIIHMLRENDRKTLLRDKILLFLGTTGTGKSTFTQYIAGDNTKLHSIELGEETGEFIIIDNERISNETTVSKTMFPELVYDSKTDTNFYDCPGFSDTRNSAADITATYVIKKLIDHSKCIKLVFIVSYPSVQKGIDRISFMELVTHAINLIKDIKKYKNSIALIVTKVNNEVIFKHGQFQLVSDERIIKKIGDFLIEVRNEQQKKLVSLKKQNTNENEKNFYDRAIDFIDILTMKKDDKYERIGIFRRPDRCGPLNEIPILQNGKTHIMHLLQNNLKYTNVSSIDFGFTISDKSRNHIYEIAEYLTEEISKNIKIILEKAVRLYQTQIQIRSKNYETLKNTLNDHLLIVQQIIKSINSNSTTEDFLLTLLKLFDKLQIEVPENNFNDIIDLNSYMHFLQNFSKVKIKNSIYEWKEALNDIEKYIKEWKMWVIFLFKIYDFISNYDTQQNTKLINDSYNAFKKGNYIDFFNSNNNNKNMFDQQILNELKNIKIDELKRAFLNNLLNAIKLKIQKQCLNADVVSIRGNFIKFSDINSLPCLSSNVKHYEIFASDTIYIDTDLVKTGEKVHLTIIAPNWQIIGNRKITLDGKPATPHPNLKARSGLYRGDNGYDGLPGKPGKPGGSFLGIGMKFTNDKNLIITTNGGAGSRGQDGGDGANGQDGERITVPTRSFYSGFCPSGYFLVNNGKYEYIDPTSNNYELTVFYYRGFKLYYGYGNNGTPGGDGGNGGAKGLEGIPGELRMIYLDKQSYIKTEQKFGANGEPGKGGNGGKSGCNFRNKIKCTDKFLPFINWQSWEELEYETCYQQLPNGKTGESGLNRKELEYPETGSAIPDPKTILKNYTKFIKDYLRNNFLNGFLRDFLKKFETNSYITRLLNTKEFENEYKEDNTIKNTSSNYTELRKKIENTKMLDQTNPHLRQKRSTNSDTLNITNKEFESYIPIDWLQPKWQFIPSNQKTISTHVIASNEDNLIDFNLDYNSVNSTLLLTDLIIKKLMKRKQHPKHYHCNNMTAQKQTALALALNILVEFEKLLNEFLGDKFITNYNPIETQTKIVYLLMNNKCHDIVQLLTTTITRQFQLIQHSHYEMFSHRVNEIIDRYLYIEKFVKSLWD